MSWARVRHGIAICALVSSVIATLVAPTLSSAHVVLGSTTLRMMTLEADFVARVRIVDPDATLVLEDPPLRESVVVAEVLESLKGTYADKELRFVQRGHGVVLYEKSEEAIVFLRRIDRVRELAKSRVAAHLHWVSQQESGAEYRLDEATRADISAAVEAYVVLEDLGEDAHVDALRRITIDMLRSPHPVLASSALRDLVLSQNAAIVSVDDLIVLEPLMDDATTPIGIRIGLIAELDRRQLIDGSARWAALLGTTKGTDQLAAVRAAGAHPSEAVATALLVLLASEDVQLVSTTAVALGGLRNDIAVSPLSKLLESEEPRLRMAAIRGLGKVGTTTALGALATAAKSHADPATRRRAAAEVEVLERGQRSRKGSP